RDREVRAGKWSRAGLPRLAGKTFGIVGLGRIGRAVADLAAGLHLNVIAHDPLADAQFAAARGIRLCEMDELLATADIVSLHIPRTPKTENMIDARALALMKPDAVLINTGRGGLVDEAALAAAMHQGRLMGAALDVFDREPLPLDSPLLDVPNLLLSTHTAGLDHQSEIDMPRIAAECVAALFRGEWPAACVINRELHPGWRW
ncbi:MAG: 3-phosphoglycerate dehydrogenase, partial [Planctomycetales bacterium]|nr:3-phosphoglycerate dehydrogenase [Planctomycetales bacterium]